MNQELVDLMFPNVNKKISDYETIYPARELPNGAYVTRYAPSPTGFVHMGALYTAIIVKKMAMQTNGICFLRIEDTDKKREVDNAVNLIIRDMDNFGITFDEGVTISGEMGLYGPYVQSKRKDIYQAFAKELFLKGLAYPCFCSEEELSELRQNQETTKSRIGYYGKYATCRKLTEDEVLTKLKNNEPYVLRLKSPGSYENRVIINDLIKGNIEFPENDLDIVLLKSDGMPTYHLAHVVDDYLMRTNLVIRGDEWLSSAPIHYQLFDVLGLAKPFFAHIAPLVKNDGVSKRKLSKRKDPEAAVSYYHEHGIPNDAVKIYLLTIANSNFEEWFDKNQDRDVSEFEMTFDKMATSGSLFDLEKLLNISKTYLANLSAEDIYDLTLEYAEEYDKQFHNILINNKDHAIKVFNIERGKKNNRKDISALSDMKKEFWYMFNELFYTNDASYMWQIEDRDLRKAILEDYINNIFDINDDNETWFNKLKDLAERHGYAREMKEYKANPDSYKGHIADIATLIRTAITSQNISPDLYSVIQCFTKEEVINRINKAIS